MTGLAKLCFYITIATFLGFYFIEAILWSTPLVYEILLPQLNPALKYEAAMQAEILKSLFINQGVYNLAVASGGVTGLVFLNRGKTTTGLAFITYTSGFGMVAALTLAMTTHAYLLAIVQFVFPALVMILMRMGPKAT